MPTTLRPRLRPVYGPVTARHTGVVLYTSDEGGVALSPDLYGAVERAGRLGVLNGLVSFGDLLFLATGIPLDEWEKIVSFHN